MLHAGGGGGPKENGAPDGTSPSVEGAEEAGGSAGAAPWRETDRSIDSLTLTGQRALGTADSTLVASVLGELTPNFGSEFAASTIPLE